MKEISDSEFAERCRVAEVPAFLELFDLLKSDVAAARALRAETQFVEKRPYLMHGYRFAAKVRGIMIEQKLPWNDEGLQKAVDQVLPDA